jgi:serine/threonine-protein kinase
VNHIGEQDERGEDAARDELLATVLAELTDRAQGGDEVDIDAACRQHAEIADELRLLWGAVMVADAAGSHASDRTGDSARRHASDVLHSLPCRFGDFELLEEIGRGGMGVVFRARQISLDRETAVKMILRGELASPDDRQRFRSEAEAAARLDHPGIVPVYNVGEHDGRPFFNMKYVAGRTLAQILAEGPMPPREAARILSAVARAIHFAHRQGVLHRDLKPSNILIDEAGNPHVTDFGLAKKTSGAASLTRTGAVLGTPAYMAPEQAAGARGKLGPAGDVYSLGSILYHMLTGRQPFQAASPVDVLLMVLEQDPVPPRVINPSAHRDLEMIALKCLQKPPELRYDSAEALADDLDAFLNDEPISARTGWFTHKMARMFRETHHATILENWGLLWMWHSLALFAACLLTNALYLAHVENRWYYVALWTVGFWTWAGVFWTLRRRMGPVTFVEWQIVHLWAGSTLAIALLFPIEWLLALPVLKLSPVLGVINGMVFMVKAGILSGAFYIQALALFLTAGLMAVVPDYAHIIFGVVSAACFFFPGLKYYRQRVRTQAER